MAAGVNRIDLLGTAGPDLFEIAANGASAVLTQQPGGVTTDLSGVDVVHLATLSVLVERIYRKVGSSEGSLHWLE